MKRRICCFCEAWGSGGIEAFLHNVLCNMELSNFEIDIVAADIRESVFTDALEQKGIHFVGLTGKLRSPENFRLFRRLLRQRRYDVIHFNLFQGLSLYYVEIARQENVGVRIVHSHGAGLRNSRTKQLKLILHRIGRGLWAKAATEHWACSRQAGAFLFGASASFQIIPNGINVKRFQFSEGRRRKVREALDLDDQVLVGTVGRLSQEKNTQFLLHVFSAFAKMHPGSRLLLVGEGEEETNLRQKAQELGIAGHVIFYGATTAVERVLAAMDIFVFPSLVEGLGIACIEAQAAGLPVLCSENIPSEAKVTSLVKTLDLCDGAQRWAEELSAMLRKRSGFDGAALVRDAGFDITEVAAMVKNKYLESGNGTA